MEKTYMVVDIDRCWGCKACQVACKYEHDVPAGSAAPVEVQRVERFALDGELLCDFVPVACQHCADPACAKVCPKGALFRDEEGLVQLDAGACIGCGACARACPYGALGPVKREGCRTVYNKCDLCARRRAAGLPASCEQHCLGGVFHSCSEGELEEFVASRQYRWSVGQVVYVSDRVSTLGEGLGS